MQSMESPTAAGGRSAAMKGRADEAAFAAAVLLTLLMLLRCCCHRLAEDAGPETAYRYPLDTSIA
jgi:hypothetical protein